MGRVLSTGLSGSGIRNFTLLQDGGCSLLANVNARPGHLLIPQGIVTSCQRCHRISVTVFDVNDVIVTELEIKLPNVK